MAPCVSFDRADVVVDWAHLSATLTSPGSLTSGPHWSGLTWTGSVDLLRSAWRNADAVMHFLDLFLFKKFQKMFKTSKNQRNSTVTPNEIIYIWKIIRKIQSIHLYHFHACQTKLYLLYRWKHDNGILNAKYGVCIWTLSSYGLHLNCC